VPGPPTQCPNNAAHAVTDTYKEGEAHEIDGDPELKISRYVDTATYRDFREINYKTSLSQRLQPTILTIFRGEVRTVEYHASTAFDDCIVREDIVYVRDAAGLATQQTKTICWCREDGSLHPLTKVREKSYSNLEKMREGHKRRSNVVDNVALLIVGLVSITEGVDLATATGYGENFTETYDTEVNNYVRVGDQNISTAVTDDVTYAWLGNDLEPIGYPAGTTIRALILEELKEILA
jgi:hypothetical protein